MADQKSMARNGNKVLNYEKFGELHVQMVRICKEDAKREMIEKFASLDTARKTKKSQTATQIEKLCR